MVAYQNNIRDSSQTFEKSPINLKFMTESLKRYQRSQESSTDDILNERVRNIIHPRKNGTDMRRRHGHSNIS